MPSGHARHRSKNISDQQQKTKMRRELEITLIETGTALVPRGFSFQFVLFGSDREVTRSSRRYCNTGATLGRGGVQAHQSQGRGLNNRLKLLRRHAPRTRD